MSDAYFDRSAVRRSFEGAAASYDDAAVLAREVERRMMERLEYVRHDPQRLLDAGCGSGQGLRRMRRRYPRAELLGVDLSLQMIRKSPHERSLLARARSLFSTVSCQYVCADIAALPFSDCSVGTVWSNLTLAWAVEPVAALSEFARVLEPGGLLMFSTYGPDTLKELRGAFAQIDAYEHVHRFVDMHDLGDMLVACGFAQPVMDMEMLTLTYDGVEDLARDLKLSGQSNAASARRRGLMSRDAWIRMSASYESKRCDGRLPATFEIVYGHAWKNAPAKPADPSGGVPLHFHPRTNR